MFWSSKNKIPAPQHQRYALAKKLYLQRVEDDASITTIARLMGTDARDFTGEEIFSSGFPEGAIIGVTEQYLMLLDKGMDENGVVQTISAFYGKQRLPNGSYPPTVPEGTSFMAYLNTFVDATGGRFKVSPQVLASHVKEIRTFYKR